MVWDIEEDGHAELLRAKGLMDKAENLVSNGNFKSAMALYQKILRIYIHAGAYVRLTEVFNMLISLIHSESDMLMVMEQIRKTIEVVKQLNLLEEEGHLKMALANLAYKNQDYLTAASIYEEIADIFIEVDEDEFRRPSGMFYLRASECFEKLHKHERANKAMFKAIRRFDLSNFDYIDHSDRLNKMIHARKYEEAVEMLREIAQFFRGLELELRHIPEQGGVFQNLIRNVSARIIHMVSEYNLLKMILYKKLGEEQKLMFQAQKSIKDLTFAITEMKEEFKHGHYSSGDLHRLTFDIFVFQFFQEFSNQQMEDPLDLVMRGLPNDLKEIIIKLKFYKYTVQILELGLEENADIFEDIPLSIILNPHRELIFKSI